MSKQNGTVISTAEYCLQTIQNLKRDMMDLGSPHQKTAMAVNGTVMILVANLLKICTRVINEAIQRQDSSMMQSLIDIQFEFNEVLSELIKAE